MSDIIQIPTILNEDAKNYKKNHLIILSIEERLKLYEQAYQSLRNDFLNANQEECKEIGKILGNIRGAYELELIRRDNYIERNQKVDFYEYRLNTEEAKNE